MDITRNNLIDAENHLPRGLSWPQWKMILIASLGGSLEFYDFIVYGFFAHNIAAQFFPNESSVVSM